MLGIKDAIRKIYSGENTLTKHMILFVLTAVPAMLSLPLNNISKVKDIDTGTVGMSLLALVLMLVISIYLCGYLYELVKNSFDETREEILPEFDKDKFTLFWKGFPLQLVWGLYLIGFVLIWLLAYTLCRMVISPAAAAIITFGIFIIFMFFFCIMIPFITVRFAKEYKRNGLYDIRIPFRDMKKAMDSVIWLCVKLLPLFLLYLIISMFGKDPSVLGYIMAGIGAYVAAISQYIMHFCYVQIYKEKLSNYQD